MDTSIYFGLYITLNRKAFITDKICSLPIYHCVLPRLRMLDVIATCPGVLHHSEAHAWTGKDVDDPQWHH